MGLGDVYKRQDKEALVSAATDLIKRLRAEQVRLANMIMRFQDEKLQKVDLLRALAMEREQQKKHSYWKRSFTSKGSCNVSW